MSRSSSNKPGLEQAIRSEARRLGFTLAGVTTPDPPQHLTVFENWLAAGRHASMGYMARPDAVARRADPRLILPQCQSILVLALPYAPAAPACAPLAAGQGQVASYAWGADYHRVLPEKLDALAAFIEAQVGHGVPHRCYTDTGPILERELAQRAGLGWIGRNTCLINARHGSYFLLSEILLGLELEPDAPIATDHCGTCTRCIQACPTECILPDRTIDAGRCVSYLTIELKEGIPPALRSQVGSWVFGCDICQAVCPWNRFAAPDGDPALAAREEQAHPELVAELAITEQDFQQKYGASPLRRAGRRGYLRNIAVALGNCGDAEALPALEQARADPDAMVREHAAWALGRISAGPDHS